MDLKKEDFVLVRTFEDKLVWVLPREFFNETDIVIPPEEEEIEIVEEEIIEEPEPEPEPTEEELAEIAKQKQIEELKAKLAELEK